MAELFSPFEKARMLPIKGMAQPWAYRNKIISPFVPANGNANKRQTRKGSTKSKKQPHVISGMYRKGTHHVIESEGCLLENELGQNITKAIKRIMQKHGIAPYDEDTGTGFLRHAVIRIGHESKEVLVTLVTNSDEFPHSKSFCKELVRQVPAITTVVQNINLRKTNVVLGERERVLYGPGFILDTLCGLSFRISSQSFYQVNAQQTEVLYQNALELARVQGATVMDAYCGTGTIGLVAAAQGAREVIGFDRVASAIQDARKNAQHNGITHATFHVCDADEIMRASILPKHGIDVLFMDPPRSGSTPEFLQTVCDIRPKRIVYISCDPETQARDVALLVKGGYAVQIVQPIDMFPHTPHIESIALLTDTHEHRNQKTA